MDNYIQVRIYSFSSLKKLFSDLTGGGGVVEVGDKYLGSSCCAHFLSLSLDSSE